MGVSPGLDQESQIEGKGLTDLFGAALSRWMGPG